MSPPPITSSNFLTKGSLKCRNSTASVTKQVNLSYGLASITNPSHTPDPSRINLFMIIQRDVVPKINATFCFFFFFFSRSSPASTLLAPGFLPPFPMVTQPSSSGSDCNLFVFSFSCIWTHRVKARPWLGLNLFQMNVIYKQKSSDKARTHLVYLRVWGGGG